MTVGEDNPPVILEGKVVVDGAVDGETPADTADEKNANNFQEGMALPNGVVDETTYLDGIESPGPGHIKPYKVSIERVPITLERRPYVPHEGDQLIDPGTARANAAPSNEDPNGTVDWAKKHEDMTVLQQHVSYWDPDGDGVIWPQDTYLGLRAFGWSIPLAFTAALIINLGLSYPTLPSWLPDPFFRIYIQRIHKANHGSDSLSFDNEGRFRPQNFEDFFAKYDQGNKGGLDIGDLLKAWKGQRFIYDFFGTSAMFVEWVATYLLLWPDDGILKKEEVRRVFDGSIFQYKATQYAEKQKRMLKEKEARGGNWLFGFWMSYRKENPGVMNGKIE